MLKTGEIKKNGISAFDRGIVSINNITDENIKLKTINDQSIMGEGNIVISGGGSGGTSDYNDLTNKPQINGVTLTGNNSTADLGIIIPDTSTLATKTELNSKANTADLAEVATSGSYNDLTNKPTIPSITGLATTTYVDSELALKADKTELPNLDNYLQVGDIVNSLTSTLSSNPLAANQGKILNESIIEVRGDITSLEETVGQLNSATLEVVTTLPATGETGVIYLVGSTSPYAEYVWIEAQNKFELIGSTSTDLSGYLKKTDVENNLTSYATTSPLSAYQGKVLADALVNVRDVQLPLKANNIDLAAVAKSGSYDDLTDKPNLSDVATTGDYYDLFNKPTIPSIDGLATTTYVDIKVATKQDKLNSTQLANVNKSFATVATSGSYNDLTNKPTIPSTSGLVNGSSNTPTVTSNIWVGTQAEYDAITTKASTTLYFIKE